MERRYERGALATGGHVTSAEVGDSGDACVFSDRGRVADLKSKGKLSGWAMSDGLAVAADGADIACQKIGFSQDRCRCLGEQDAHFHIEWAEFVDAVMPRAHGGMYALRYRVGEWFGVGRDQGKFVVRGDGYDD